MGTTLAVWKWAGGIRGNKALAKAAFDRIAADQCSPALTRFDAAGLRAAIERELRNEDGPLLEIDAGDFSGQPCNWLIVTGGFASIYHSMPRLVELAKSFGAAVYDADEDRLITAAAAAKYTAAVTMAQPSARLDNERILADQIAPSVRAVGFRVRGHQFTRDDGVDGERLCSVRVIVNEYLGPLVLTVVFPRLLDLENRYRAYCQEPTITSAGYSHLWEQVQLPHYPHNGYRSPEERDAHGARVTEVIVNKARDHFDKQPRTIGELTRAWAPLAEHMPVKLAAAYWVLGEQSKARELLAAQLHRLNELLKVKYHPPSRSDRVEIEFFMRFLETL